MGLFLCDPCKVYVNSKVALLLLPFLS
uniref:Uncharacterized protein n=1 Tax=Rhizophora mucronata TaxID=61149 RepID=A0A2P2LFD8_RHIMU